MLYAGPNTGIYFQISLGVLVGIALGATAMSVPVSEVGKHFPNQRTIATGVVTAAASVGYFLVHYLLNFFRQFRVKQTLKNTLCILFFWPYYSIFFCQNKMKLLKLKQKIRIF